MFVACPEDKMIYSLYLDQELNGTQKKKFEQHTQNCKKCQKELEALKLLQQQTQKSFQLFHYYSQNGCQSQKILTKILGLSKEKIPQS
ncbi:MAG: hypothetical protein D6805_08680 [Planctomycetota bacterium]|nr:MAG: hypothetical protein D6805_08680 [Planctomycetota bacterium]